MLDFDQIRKLTITALFSDDMLIDKLVLKGGNAISLVYGFGSRGSLDLDFSLEQDFEDFTDAQTRMFASLADRFSSVGLIVFDETFEPKPATSRGDRWGGYELSFKLIERPKYQQMHGSPDTLRRNALEVAPNHLRKFRVEFSKFEYCAGKSEMELDHYTIYVYTPAMLVIEKLRAICQQMREYTRRRHPQPRARDFYDIYSLTVNAEINLTDQAHADLAKSVFEAKEVPLSLLGRIADQREFHRPDWPAVQLSVGEQLKEFDFYFDFVVEQAAFLKALWVE